MAQRYDPSSNRYRHAVDPIKCMASVPGSNGLHSYQCSRKRREGSEWCTQHSPEAEAAREAKAKARYLAENKRYAAAAKAKGDKLLREENAKMRDLLVRGIELLEGASHSAPMGTDVWMI